MPAEKQVPGTAPGAEVKSAEVDVQRYGSPPASVEGAPRRADSARAMIEEIVEREIAKRLGKEKDLAQEGTRRVEAEQRAAQERQEAADRERAKKLESLVDYEATGPGYVDLQDGRGGRLVVAGQRFKYGGDPSPSWMKALNDEGQKRIDRVVKQREERRRLADEDQVAMSALDKAKASIERSSVGRAR
jgi:hypothetical protein